MPGLREQIAKKLPLLALLLLAAALLTLTAVRTQARPHYSNQCSGCHPNDMPTTWISVSVASETDTDISYNVTGSNNYDAPEGWAVFSPASTNIANGTGPGSFTLPKDGNTYRVYWVDDADSCADNPPSCSKGGSAYQDITTPLPPTPTPTPTATPAPTPTPTAPPGPTPTPTATPAPTPPPTPTPTPTATATPTPPPAPTPTPTPAPTPGPGGFSAVFGSSHDLGSAGNPTCKQCHIPHKAQAAYLWARTPSGALSGLGSLCFSCHDGSVTDVGYFIPDPSYQSHPVDLGVDDEDCDRCHDAHRGDRWHFTKEIPGVSWANANLCGFCHDTGALTHPNDVLSHPNLPVDRVWDPYANPADFSGTRLFNDAGTDVLPSGDGYIKCATCHVPHGGIGEAMNSMAYSESDSSHSPICENCHH